MAKRSGGFPGMGGNMNQLMKQAQKMQKQMEETINIKEEVVDPDDVEMLEDLIVAATNEALRKMEEDSQEKMGKVTGGLGGMGGGFPF